jgi:membrane protein DedA with SNARE-associated domain
VNPITWVQGLNGATLIVVICVLMFTEETGVPLPFAPGDLVLAIAGIAVAGGRVNPSRWWPPSR